MSGKLGQFSSMYTEDLITKLVSHVFDHFFSSTFFENLLVHCHHILLFKCQSCYAIFTILNSALAVNVLLKVLLELLLIIKVIFLPFVNQETSCVDIRLIVPLNGGIGKLFRVDVNESILEASIYSLSFSLIFVFLPCGCVLRIGNVFLGLVIVFEGDFLQLSYFC